MYVIHALGEEGIREQILLAPHTTSACSIHTIITSFCWMARWDSHVVPRSHRHRFQAVLTGFGLGHKCCRLRLTRVDSVAP